MHQISNNSNRDWWYLLSFTFITILNYYLFLSSELLVKIYAAGLPATLGLSFFLYFRIKASEINFVTLLGLGHLLQFILFSLLLSPFYYYKQLYIQGDLLQVVPELILATLIGQVMLFIGYYSNKNKLSAKSVFSMEIRPRIVKLRGNLFLPFLIYIPIWIVRYILIVTGSYYHNVRSEFQFESSLFSPIAQISTLNGFIIAYFFILYFELKRNAHFEFNKIKILIFVILVLELVWALPSGSRETTLTVLIIPFIVFFKYYKKVPKKVFLIVSALIIFYIAFAKLYQAETIKSDTNPNSVNISNTSKLVQNSFYQLQEGSDILGYQFYLPFMSRMWDGISLSIILSRYDAIYDYENGNSYVGVFYFFIPRFLFPNKPISQLALNDWFPEIILHGSMPTTFIGESYINFGWVGIILVPLIVGFLIKYFDIFFIKRSSNIIWSALYLSLVYSILRLTVQPVRIWVSTLVYNIIFGFLLVLIFNKSQRSKTVKIYNPVIE